MNILIFESLQLEGLYVADLLSYKALTSSLVSIHHHTVDPFTQFVHTTSPLVTINLLSVSKILLFFIVCSFVSLDFTGVKSNSICLSSSKLFQIPYCLQGLPILSQMAGFNSFIWLNCILLCVYVCVCVCALSCVRLFAITWTVGSQAPLSMGFFQKRILEWVAISSNRGST